MYLLPTGNDSVSLSLQSEEIREKGEGRDGRLHLFVFRLICVLRIKKTSRGVKWGDGQREWEGGEGGPSLSLLARLVLHSTTTLSPSLYSLLSPFSLNPDSFMLLPLHNWHFRLVCYCYFSVCTLSISRTLSSTVVLPRILQRVSYCISMSASSSLFLKGTSISRRQLFTVFPFSLTVSLCSLLSSSLILLSFRLFRVLCCFLLRIPELLLIWSALLSESDLFFHNKVGQISRSPVFIYIRFTSLSWRSCLLIVVFTSSYHILSSIVPFPLPFIANIFDIDQNQLFYVTFVLFLSYFIPLMRMDIPFIANLRLDLPNHDNSVLDGSSSSFPIGGISSFFRWRS